MENKKIKGQEKNPNTIAQPQTEIDKLKLDNSKLKSENDGMRDKIKKRDIQLLRAALKFEKQEMTFMKQKAKLEQKILELQTENRKLRNPLHDIHPVDLSLYSRPSALDVEAQKTIDAHYSPDK